MSININSESYCRRAYLNYHCYGNTMGITAEEMGQITQTWSSKISSWQNSVSSDETEYEFDDSDYSNYKAKGENSAKDATGYDGNNGGSVAHTVGDAASSITGAGITIAGKVAAKTGGGLAGTSLAKAAGQQAAIKAGQGGVGAGGKVYLTEAGKATAAEGTKQAGKAAGFIIGCVMGAITAAAYWIKKPNKEEKEACDVLLTEMGTAQGTLSETQDDMANMANEIMELSDEANSSNEDANSEIEEKKSEYDMYMRTYEALKAKVDSGEALSESEKSLYKSIVGYLEETGSSIDEISEEATDTVSDLYGEIEGYQSGYDDAAAKMAEVEGLTDFAASFDKTTRVMCYVEGAAQTLNAASSAYSAYEAAAFAASGTWAFGATAWAWAFAAVGLAAAASSGVSAGQQFKWGGEIGNEIEAREATQDLNTGTMDMYDEELDGFAGALEGVEDLELAIPDDVAPPEDDGAALATTNTPTPDNKKPPKGKTV